jgi:hypothetical protein
MNSREFEALKLRVYTMKGKVDALRDTYRKLDSLYQMTCNTAFGARYLEERDKVGDQYAAVYLEYMDILNQYLRCLAGACVVSE